MSQIKIYANQSTIQKHRMDLSNAIHQALVTTLEYPIDKRFHRFIALTPEDFIYPVDRSEAYTIIEISMFIGRSSEAKKRLIQQIFSNIEKQCGITPQDVEITIFETPKENWGIRGQNADELQLNYKINI
ncbi:tautomerase family protein [Acinetobacter sp. WU_MDCI_Axc73]|nr:tautomerase family protein [Acinetobacter sp. WU_MDCI_Axc73]